MAGKSRLVSLLRLHRAMQAVFLFGFIVACDRRKPTSPPENQPMAQGKVFRTSDFEFLMPVGWQFLESESRPDLTTFQSADEQSRLIISDLYLQRELNGEEARMVFTRFIELRRTAESEPSSQVQLSEHKIGEGDGYWYSKWGGRELAVDRRTATLITLEKKKVFTLFVESIGTSDQALDSLASEIFRNFKAK